MAYIQRRKNRGGSVSFLAQVKVEPFRPPTKSFPSRAGALAWATALERELKAQRKRGGTRSDIAKLTVGELINEFLADPETQGLRYVDDLTRLLAWWVNAHAATKTFELGVLKLRDARDKLLTKRGPATVNRYLSAMRACWNWGRASALIPQERSWPARLMLTEPAGRVRFLTDAELKKLLEASEKDRVMSAAIIVSLSCGLRQGELLRLEWRDVDFDRAAVTVRIAKNKTSRSVYLVSAAAAALAKLRKGALVSPTHVFLNTDGTALRKGMLETRWRKIREAAGLKDFHWHDLRHSCASFLAQKGASLLQIGSVLGHKSPAMTARYSHLVAGAAVPGHDELNRKLQR
jgi:integrase